MEQVKFTKQAIKDFEKFEQYPDLKKKVIALIELIRENPFESPPSYEKLLGFDHVYSRRINQQHRLIYEVRDSEKIVAILRMWSHYE